ncbi:MAG: hypothetical protein ABL907_19815, partial [Hyphomicrobium sp.]
MAWEFNAFAPLVAPADELIRFAFTGNMGTSDTVEVRIIGTGLGYNPVTGTFAPGAEITQMVLFDTTTLTALQTVDIDPTQTAAVALAANVLLASALDIGTSVQPLLPPAFDDVSAVYAPGGLTLTVTLTNGGTP